MKTETVPFEATVSQALSILEGLGSVRSLTVAILTKYLLLENYDPVCFSSEIKSLSLNVNNYDHRFPDVFSRDYQATVLLSKLPPKNCDSRLRDSAIEDFKRSEARNALVNRDWDTSCDIVFTKAYSKLSQLGLDLLDLRKIISNVLGRAPSLATLDREVEWSSGASVGLGRFWSSGECKAEMGVTVTYPLARALSELVTLSPLINKERWVLVPGNLVTTVRKNISTDRTIAMEADINALFQRAIGSRLAKRLRRFGIYLDDQTLNQRACLQAQRFKNATIDIKNASNSALRNVVYSLFPDDWVSLIDLTRSHRGTFSNRNDVHAGQAEWFEYEMLSSMGNGYTFELESLLFFSICIWCGCDDFDTFIYGDDIIIPQSKCAIVTSALSVFGFEVNLEKSFTSGTFFESCGVFAYNGVDVTPLKIKDLLNDDKSRIILANKLRMYAHLLNNRDGCDRRLLPAWRMCIQGISSSVRRNCRGPVGSGLLLYCNLNESNSVYTRKRASLRVSHLVPRLRESYEADWESLLQYRIRPKVDRPAFGVSIINYGNIVLQKFNGYVRKDLFIEGNWYNFGHWQ